MFKSRKPAIPLDHSRTTLPDLVPIALDYKHYERKLSDNPRWALSEGSQFFEGKGAVQEALLKITGRLTELGIPYAIVGGMALFRHGYRRFTEDVDILVTKDGLNRIHEQLQGLGYIQPFPNSRNLREVTTGVKIEFLVTAGFPGDGKPKPIAFPDPTTSSFESDGIRYLKLNVLIELKLASGMTNPSRAKDLADVIELIKTLNLPEAYAKELHPFVQAKFQELQKLAQTRYVALKTPDSNLSQMLKDGITIEPQTPDRPDLLVTTDPEIALKYSMVAESDFWQK